MKIKQGQILLLGKVTAFVAVLFLGYKSFLYTQVWFDTTLSPTSTLGAIASASTDDLDSVNQNGQTGLMVAAALNSADQAEAFVDAGANIRKAQENNYKGNTAWHFAILAGAKDVIKVLLKAGTPLWLPNTLGERSSHVLLAIFNYPLREEVANLLFENGMQWNLQNNFGNTMIHDAVKILDKTWIRWVMENYGNYIDLDIKNSEGRTPEELANFLGYNDDLDSAKTALYAPYYVVGRGQLGYQEADKAGTTALMFAAYKGDIDKVKQYIKDGASLSSANDGGLTALHMAMVSTKPLSAVTALIDAGAGVNVSDRKGRQAINLLYLVEQPENRLSILNLLSKNGADIKHADNDGFTVASRAQQQGDVIITKALEKMAQ